MSVPIWPAPVDGIYDRSAKLLGKTLEGFLYDVAHQRYEIPIDEEGVETVRTVPVCRVSGHTGYTESDVLVVSKGPNNKEANIGAYYVDEVGDLWQEFFREKKLNIEDWVMSGVIQFRPPDYLAGKGQIKAVFLREGLAVLSRAYNAVKPRYVLCFGADAFKAVHQIHGLKPKDAKFDNCRGAVIELPDGVKCIAAISPQQVMVSPESHLEFTNDLELFYELITSGEVTDKWPEPESIVVDTVEDLSETVDALIADNKTLFACDLEWGENDALRTAQFAWSSTEALVVHFTSEGLVPTPLGKDHDKAIGELKRLVNRPGVGLIGHNFRGDIKVMRRHGMDMLPQFLDLEAGSMDTMLAHHLMFELNDQQLELVSLKLLDAPRYDKPLRDWLVATGRGKKTLDKEGYGEVPDDILIPYAAWDACITFALSEKLKEMIAEYPGIHSLYRNIVHPVNEALLEMEETGTLVDEQALIKASDLFNKKKDELKAKLQKTIDWRDYTYYEYKPSITRLRAAVWGITKGLVSSHNTRLSDKSRKLLRKHIDDLADYLNSCVLTTDITQDIQNKNFPAIDAFLVNEVSKCAPLSGYPTNIVNCAISAFTLELPKYLVTREIMGFNPDSVDQVRELLFSRFKDHDPANRLSPPHVELLNLTPVKSTDDTPWDEVVSAGKDKLHNPAVDSETREILIAESKSEVVELLHEYKLVAQVCKNFIRPYEIVDGKVVWEKGMGIGGNLSPDKRLRVSYKQTLETGRYATSPNCFSHDTEILTDKGWVLFPDLDKTSLVAQYDTYTGEIDFDKPEAYIEHPYKGKLQHIYTAKHIDLLVTPDHQCLLRTAKGHWTKHEAYRYSIHRQQFHAGDYLQGKDKPDKSHLDLIAAYWDHRAVNDMKDGDRVVEWRYRPSDKRLKELRSILYEARIPVTIGKDRFGLQVITAELSKFPEYVRKHLDLGAWVIDLDYDYKVYFLERFKWWDSVYTEEIASWVQMLHILTGKRASMIKQDNPYYAADKPDIKLSTSRRAFSTTTRTSMSEVQYDGIVYCVTMPKGTVIVRRNGRVHITGNCQNFPNSREATLKKIFSDTEYMPIKSVFRASPGKILIEADWSAAESWTLGELSEDDAMLKALASADFHCATMRDMFATYEWEGKKLIDYTVDELNELRDLHVELKALRTASKTINFGIPYSRGGVALSREISKQGVPCTPEEGLAHVQAWKSKYKKASAYLERCKQAVLDPGYLDNPFGRRRHFPYTEEQSIVAGMQREATNFNIQSTVGDAMSLALINLKNYKDKVLNQPDLFRILMSIHDAIVLEVPIENVDIVCSEVIPLCMSDAVEVPNSKLKLEVGSYDLQLIWGETPDPEELLKLGVPRKWCGFKE